MVSTLYPFTGRHFTTRSGHSLHYLDEGHGPPIVCVHGNPTWSFYWRNLVGTLRDSFRMIAPDHIGCGLSDKPQPPAYDYALKSRIDDLEALLESLGIRENITLALHDWGGMIGLGYAARHPGRVKRLILFNTAGFGLPAAKKLPFALKIGRNTTFGTWLIRRWNLFARLAAKIGTKRRPMSDDVRKMYLAPYDSWDNRIAVSRFVQTIPLSPTDVGYDIVQSVEASLVQYQNVPVFIGWGLKDFVFDRHFLEEWKRRLPQAEVHAFADAGHYVLEDAADELLPAVRTFLANHP